MGQKSPASKPFDQGTRRFAGEAGIPFILRDGEPLRGRSLAVLVETKSGERPLADIVRECWTKLEEMAAAPRPIP